MSSKAVVVAIGGATCSGKTTLAKHLRQIIPRAVILHQDDFAPPEEELPLHPVLNVRDWDTPETALLWEKQRETLHYVKSHASLPEGHDSHDHLNVNQEVTLSAHVREEWITKFSQIDPNTCIILFDGFLVFYDAASRASYDLSLFVREDQATLLARRSSRNYHTAEGTVWKDPEGYWESVVWPAYVSAHAHLFVDGNVEKGVIKPEEQIVLLEAATDSMDTIVNTACQAILDTLS